MGLSLVRLGHSQSLTTIIASIILIGIPALSCFAQSAADEPVAIDLRDVSRDQLYDALAEEVKLLERQGSLLKRVVKLVKPNVVHIEAERIDENWVGGAHAQPQEEAGSGVIIRLSSKFYILTNRHVIKHSSLPKIRIKLSDGRLLHPLQIWSDRGTDIAVMEISAENLFPARVGDSSQLEIGDFVLAVGSPFGLSHSVTFGIISAKGRRDLRLGNDSVRFQDFIQTDASINPGNSGGPLLNLRGEVIGINTAIATNSGGSEGIGFSIPINMVMIVARQLIDHGTVVRAFLGVHLDANFGAEAAESLGLSHPEGALVSGITPNSPAEDAELRSGDVILSFDGTRIEDDNHLVNLVSLTPVGKEVELVILRQREPVSLRVHVGDRGSFNTAQ